ASSVSVMNLIVLAHLVEDSSWIEEIEATLRLFAPKLEQMGRAVPMMAAALSAYVTGVQQIVLVGDAAERAALARVVARRYLPFTVTISLNRDRQETLAETMPLVASMRAADGGAAAYLCRDFACQPPVSSAGELEGMLQ